MLAPHPDDETIGCGATIARKRAQSTEVEVWIATDGRGSASAGDVRTKVAAREHEAPARAPRSVSTRSACTFFGVEDGTLANTRSRWRRRWPTSSPRGGFEELYVPSPDDAARVIIGRCSTAAVRAVDRAGVPMTCSRYPVWFWSKHTWIARSGNRLHAHDALPRRAARGGGRASTRSRSVPIPISVASVDALEEYEGELDGLQLDTDRWFLGDRELFFRIG